LARPDPDSPVRGAAWGIDHLSVTNDIDGQPRLERLDTGCDQISDPPIINHPLNASETGPAWLNRLLPKY
jgi:hypothetical protein